MHFFFREIQNRIRFYDFLGPKIPCFQADELFYIGSSNKKYFVRFVRISSVLSAHSQVLLLSVYPSNE